MSAVVTESCLVCPAGTIPGPTGTCDRCGSRYVRGVLVQAGAVRKSVPIRQRMARDPEPIHFDSLQFQHYEHARTRDEAVRKMYESYDRQRGRRRRPSREAFEVVGAVNESESGIWILSVRRTGS